MEADPRPGGDARLEAALRDRQLADPRPAYRERLRALRGAHPEAFERARTHYETAVRPALAAADPVDAWIAYGAWLGGLTAAGRLVDIDAEGRAGPHAEPHRADRVVLWLPDDGTEPAFTAMAPAEPTPAQRAAIGLLVERRLALTD
jgi:hypothetical protein